MNTSAPEESDYADIEKIIGRPIHLRPKSEEFEALSAVIAQEAGRTTGLRKAFTLLEERVLNLEAENSSLKDALEEALKEIGATTQEAPTLRGALDWQAICLCLSESVQGFDTLLPIWPKDIASAKKNLAKYLTKFGIQGKFRLFERDNQVFATQRTE